MKFNISWKWEIKIEKKKKPKNHAWADFPPPAAHSLSLCGSHRQAGPTAQFFTTGVGLLSMSRGPLPLSPCPPARSATDMRGSGPRDIESNPTPVVRRTGQWVPPGGDWRTVERVGLRRGVHRWAELQAKGPVSYLPLFFYSIGISLYKFEFGFQFPNPIEIQSSQQICLHIYMLNSSEHSMDKFYLFLHLFYFA